MRSPRLPAPASPAVPGQADGPSCRAGHGSWTVEPPRVPCRFGCRAPAVAIVHYPEGCHCWPDPVQALCSHHTLKGLDNNHGVVIAVLVPGAALAG